MRSKDSAPVKGDPHHDFRLVPASEAVVHDFQASKLPPHLAGDFELVTIPPDAHPLISRQEKADTNTEKRNTAADRMHIMRDDPNHRLISSRGTIRNLIKDAQKMTVQPEVLSSRSRLVKAVEEQKETHLDKIVDDPKYPLPEQESNNDSKTPKDHGEKTGILKTQEGLNRDKDEKMKLEQQKEIDAARAENDKKLIEGGAHMINNKNSEGKFVKTEQQRLHITPDQYEADIQEMEEQGKKFKPDTDEDKKKKQPNDEQVAGERDKKPKINEKNKRKKDAKSIIKQLTTRARNLFRPAYTGYEAHYSLPAFQEVGDEGESQRVALNEPLVTSPKDPNSVIAEATRRFAPRYDKPNEPLENDPLFQGEIKTLSDLQKKRSLKGADEEKAIRVISQLLSACEDIKKEMSTVSEFKDNAPHVIALAEAITGHSENGVSKLLRKRAEAVIRSLDPRNKMNLDANDRTRIQDRLETLITSKNTGDAYRILVLSFLNDKDLHPTHLATILGIPQARQVVMDVLEIEKIKKEPQTSSQESADSQIKKNKVAERVLSDEERSTLEYFTDYSYLPDESKSAFERYYAGSDQDIESSYKQWADHYFSEQYNFAKGADSCEDLPPVYRSRVSFFARVNGIGNLEDALKQWQQHEQTKENVQSFTNNIDALDQYERLSLNAVLPQYMREHGLSDVEEAYNRYNKNLDKPSDEDVQQANSTLEIIRNESEHLTDEERDATDFKRLQWIFARETLVQELENIRPPTAVSDSLIKGLIEIIERNTDFLNQKWRYSKTLSEVKKAIKVLDRVNVVSIPESLALNSFLPDSIDPDIIADIVERYYGYDQSEMKYDPVYSAAAVRYREAARPLNLKNIHYGLLFRQHNTYI